MWVILTSLKKMLFFFFGTASFTHSALQVELWLHSFSFISYFISIISSDKESVKMQQNIAAGVYAL